MSLTAVDFDPWLDPELIGCIHGDNCRHARKWRAEARAKRDEYLDRQAKLSALTDSDVAWLVANGWNGD